MLDLEERFNCEFLSNFSRLIRNTELFGLVPGTHRQQHQSIFSGLSQLLP